MTEREQQPYPSGSPPVRDGSADGPDGPDGPGSPAGATRFPVEDDWRDQTIPGLTPIPGGTALEPGGHPTGFPGAEAHGATGYGTGGHGTGGYGAPTYDADDGYGPPGYGTGGYDLVTGAFEPTGTVPPYSNRPVAFRRAESLGGLLLVLSGIAGGVSLLLRWVHGQPDTGWQLLRTGLGRAGADVGAFLTDGWWEPVVVVLGGAALFVLGLLLFLPLRTHRFLGIVALLVALVVTAGVLVPLAQDGWVTSGYDLGFWFAVATAALGLLGAFKAMLTGPRFRTVPPEA